MGQGQSSVFDLAAVAAASNGGNNDPLLPPARFIGDPQKPSRMPYNKYAAYDKQIPFDYPERTWPGKRLQRAPRWCSVDLRDGNQALVNPMDSERKLRFWNLLVSMGFKEIEVGFPSASETDFDFIRMLIERELIPGRRDHRGTHPVPRAPHPPHLRGAQGCQARHRALLQLRVCVAARGRVPQEQGGDQEARHRRRRTVQGPRERGQGHRPCTTSTRRNPSPAPSRSTPSRCATP